MNERHGEDQWRWAAINRQLKALSLDEDWANERWLAGAYGEPLEAALRRFLRDYGLWIDRRGRIHRAP